MKAFLGSFWDAIRDSYLFVIIVMLLEFQMLRMMYYGITYLSGFSIIRNGVIQPD